MVKERDKKLKKKKRNKILFIVWSKENIERKNNKLKLN